MQRAVHHPPPPRDSIAGVVLRARETRRPARVRFAPGAPPSDSIAGVVLAVPRRVAATRLAAAGVLAALCLHASGASVAFWARATERAPEIRPSIATLHEVELPPEPAEPPRPEPEPPPPPPPKAERPPPSPEPPAPAEPAPAQAAEIVSAVTDVAPLDFTGGAFAAGAGTHFAGGVTASAGTSLRAAAKALRVSAPPRAESAKSLARPVRLVADDWRCPWPREADELGIDEQLVVLRVLVGIDGRAASAELVSEPGHGFGRAALSCARGMRYEPALDASGAPRRALSPPIRVKFTR